MVTYQGWINEEKIKENFKKFTLKEKLLIFYRLLKTKYIQKGYTFEQILEDEF